MSFWEGKKVLVTGAHGFVGKNLMSLLQTMQQSVSFEILAPTRIEVDLTSEKQVAEYFWKHKPNIVLHLAGKVGGIGANKAKPADFFYQNIMMGTLVMHYAHINGAEKVVALAAGCGYPKMLPVPYAEAKERGDKEVVVWGTGVASREFLYSLDTAQAIIDMTEKVNETGPFNLGTGVETTIKKLVETISELTGFDGDIVWDTSKPDGQPRRFYDMRRFREAVGYIPDTSLKDGLQQTIEWFKNEC